MHSVAHLIQVLVHDPPVPPKCVNLLQQPPLDVRIPCDAVNAEAEGVGGGLIAREDESIALSHDLQSKQARDGREGGRADSHCLPHRQEHWATEMERTGRQQVAREQNPTHVKNFHVKNY
jgi:hypothetical protein